MKKILIYGDSNTWGDNFITGERIPDDKQWPHILEANLKDYKILQEGLPGRIAGDYEDIKKYKNGKDSFLSTFRVNAPVDIVIIALGTNDLQLRYDKSSDEVIKILKWYKEAILNQFEDLEDRKKIIVNAEKIAENLKEADNALGNNAIDAISIAISFKDIFNNKGGFSSYII